MTIPPDEKAELQRIIEGGDFNAQFWNSRWQEARVPSAEDEIRAQLQAMPTETVLERRAARKLQTKLNKLAGQARALVQMGYERKWSDEQKRLSNLEQAAIYISRANQSFYFYA